MTLSQFMWMSTTCLQHKSDSIIVANWLHSEYILIWNQGDFVAKSLFVREFLFQIYEALAGRWM